MEFNISKKFFTEFKKMCLNINCDDCKFKDLALCNLRNPENLERVIHTVQEWSNTHSKLEGDICNKETTALYNSQYNDNKICFNCLKEESQINCDICHKNTKTVYDYKGMLLCEDCLKKMINSSFDIFLKIYYNIYRKEKKEE